MGDHLKARRRGRASVSLGNGYQSSSTLEGEKPLDVVISHSHRKNSALVENGSLVVMDFWVGIG